jgi:GT2 family glycosyltransferase
MSPVGQPDTTTGEAELSAKPPIRVGSIDMYGFGGGLSGWIFCGWIGRTSGEALRNPVEIVVRFEESEIRGMATVAVFDRQDLGGPGSGIIIFATLEGQLHWTLREVELAIGGAQFRAVAGRNSTKLQPQDIPVKIQPILTDRVKASQAREECQALLSRAYVGDDTLAALERTVRLEIDEAIICPPDGLLLMGWSLFTPGAIKSVRVCSGSLAGDISFKDSLTIARPDVMAIAESKFGSNLLRSGFFAFVPHVYSPNDETYIEIETRDGKIGFRKFDTSKRHGLAAIRRILSDLDVRHAELDDAFDRHIGPAVAALNADRLSAPNNAATIEFGAIPLNPKCSVIVPLFGRMDFIEYQMAMFSKQDNCRDIEFIYVLDDPPLRRQLENLGQSVFARFEIPFRLVLLPKNVGFAPANNRGLSFAKGQFVCFLNSDAFPGTPDWIDRLTDRLVQDPGIGVIGPALLFEDGSVQHVGCFYRPLKEFGNWVYVDHDFRGRRPGEEKGIRYVPAITGACMVMDRPLAQEIGGFDEAFIIGDFEDSDLCKKIRQRGLSCAVDLDTICYHLERKSQAGSSERWRQNLTLYNAWVHQRRWYPQGTPTEAEMLADDNLSRRQGAPTRDDT